MQNNFIEYVLSFYGKGGIYDYGFTESEVILATDQHIKRFKHNYKGDSVDREIVRDIVLDNRNTIDEAVKTIKTLSNKEQ